MDVMEIISRIDAAFANDDYRGAFEIAKPYAEQGHPWAQTCLGSLYQCGLGVNMDLREAERYFRAAAEQGHAGAWYSLGVLYEVGGDDFPDDPEKASSITRKRPAWATFPDSLIRHRNNIELTGSDFGCSLYPSHPWPQAVTPS